MAVFFKPLTTKEEWQWLAERAKCAWTDDTRGIVGYRDGILAAGVALDSWSKTSVCIHVAIEDPMVLRHGLVEETFRYIFQVAGRSLVIGVTPGDNKRALRFNRHLGFREIYRIKDAYDVGVDYVVQELRKEDCRYIDHGQEIRSSAA